jgi:hypothetical protein
LIQISNYKWYFSPNLSNVQSKTSRKRTIDQLNQMDDAPASRRVSKTLKPSGRKSGIKSTKEFDVIEIYGKRQHTRLID